MKYSLSLALIGASVSAISINFTNDVSTKDGASTIAYGLMKYYKGNETGQIPGTLPKPYYWWETGALFTTMIDYWAKTGDDTYNQVTAQGLLYQVGDNNDFMPANQSKADEGNDDQGVWALAAMAAAEYGFPGPSEDQPQWQDLAVNVFDEFVGRWDTDNCGGGLRWMSLPFEAGYSFINSASNGVFFDLAARLFLQTRNSTYSQWATEVFEWEQKAGLISDSYQVFLGFPVSQSCNNTYVSQNTMDAGLFLHGSAVMYNATTSKDWKTRVDGLIKNVGDTFFKDGILFEVECEGYICNDSQKDYRGFLVRSLQATTQLAPYTGATIHPLLLTNAKAAANACSGTLSTGFSGKKGTACGFSWTATDGKVFDGQTSLGTQMNALSVVVSTLSRDFKVPSNRTSEPSETSEPGAATTTTESSSSRVYVGAMTGLVVLSGVVCVGLL